MLVEDFISSIVSQFKDPKDDERNRSFYTNISTLAYKCKPELLKRLYDYIIRSEENTFPFSMGKYYKYMDKNDMAKPENAKRDVSWLTCVSCGTHYSTVGRGCPSCREKKATIWHGETYPEKMHDVTEDCYYCTIFQESKKHNKWMTYKDCNDYGKKQEPSCGPCQCKECCKQMISYNNDPRGTIERYRKGIYGQPWLYEVDPLNETVRLMIEDIARRQK